MIINMLLPVLTCHCMQLTQAQQAQAQEDGEEGERADGTTAGYCLRPPAGPPDLLIDLSVSNGGGGGGGGGGAPSTNVWEDCACLLTVAPATGELLLGGVPVGTAAGACTVSAAASAAAGGCTFR